MQEACRGHAPTLMAKAGTDIRKVKSKALAKAYREGDEGIKAVLGRAAEYLAMGIAAAVDLLGPDCVVIGGGLAVAMPEVFIDGIGDKVRQFASPALVEDLKIVPAELGDLATVVGACLHGGGIPAALGDRKTGPGKQGATDVEARGDKAPARQAPPVCADLKSRLSPDSFTRVAGNDASRQSHRSSSCSTLTRSKPAFSARFHPPL
ncbi:MAG: ROK family protein [Verrucomicrobiales bacterium]